MTATTELDERALAAALNAYGVDAVVDGLEAAIRAYLSALPASGAGWRDMESAPKDERLIIVFDRYLTPHKVFANPELCRRKYILWAPLPALPSAPVRRTGE